MRNPFVFGRDLWDPSHRFETSWLLPPVVLGALRALFALYIFVQLVFILAWQCSHPTLGGCDAAREEFSYFTVLTDWGLAFYFLVSAVHTLSYALGHGGAALLDRFPRPLQALHSFFYSTITVYPFIVTAVYWGGIYSGPWFPLPFNAWRNVSQHAMNSGFALFEIVVARTAPPPWVHAVFLLAVMSLYLGLAYVTVATKGFYVYSFLDPSDSKPGYVAAYVFGIAVACVVVFAVVRTLIWVRQWLTETKLGMTGKFAHSKREAIDVEVNAENKV